MERLKTPKLSLPFVWPIPSDGSESKSAAQRVPFEQLAANAASIAGIVSEIDSRGVDRIERILSGTQCRALVVIAVYAGSPTRSEYLKRLIGIQDQRKGEIEFRILPMPTGIEAPANCLTVIPTDGSTPICLLGDTPTFGIARNDSTQLNMAFRPEPALTDEWFRWFDRTWAEAAPLTESTARIPSLVLATGSDDADAQWREYCSVCSDAQPKKREQDKTPKVPDENVGVRRQTSASNQPTQQCPSVHVGLHKLDPLAERVTRLLGKGQQVTVVYAGAIGPLDVPINARFFNQDPEKWSGTVVRRQSFRISAFSKEDQKMIDEYRKASRLIINKLALPFETGLYWMPYEMIPIFKEEIEAAEVEAKDELNKLVSPYTSDFIQGKRTQIEHDLQDTYRDIGGQGDLPRGKLTEILNILEGRIQNALESNIVTPISFLDIKVDLQRSQAHETPWTQMEKLVLALARYPRRIISNPKVLQGIRTEPSFILDAMDVEDDALLPFNDGCEENVIHNAKRELDLLERIAESDIVQRDRCEVYFMIIDGKSNAEIHDFINRN